MTVPVTPPDERASTIPAAVATDALTQEASP